MAIQLSGSLQLTGSLFVDGDPVVLANQTSSLSVSSASFASTASYADAFTVAGEIVAQTLNVQQVTSSVVYSSGSNVFGNSVSNTQQFTGSLQVSGSTHYLLGNVGIGTTSPAFKTTVYSTSSTDSFPLVVGQPNDSNQFVGIGLSGYVAGNGAVKAGIVLDRKNTFGVGDIHILNNTTTDNSNATLADARLTILQNGNVGIGTTSPTQKLHVEGSPAIGTTGTEDILVLGRALSVGTSFQQAASFKLGRYQNAGGSFESYTRLDIALKDNSAASNYSTNTTVMTLTNAGNVGIGTTSPAHKLDVRDGTITSRDATNTNYAELDRFVGLTLKGNGAGSRTIKTPNTDALTFGTNNTERMRIDSSGKVGIGTTSPQNLTHIFGGSDSQENVLLKVQSNGVANDGSLSTSILLANSTADTSIHGAKISAIRTSSSTDDLVFYNYNVSMQERMRIDSSGNVKIGNNPTAFGKLTISDSSPFVVVTSTSTSSSGFAMFVNNGSNGVGVITTDDGGHMTFDTGATGAGQSEKMRITSSGNVGIGTTSITTAGGSYKGMQIKGSSGASLVLSNTSHNNYIYTGDTLGDFAIEASSEFRLRTNGGERMRIDSSGNVGIGGTAGDGYRLQLVGTTQDGTTLGMTYLGVAAGAIKITSTGAMAFGLDGADGSTERMRITSAGNVGIGTTSPGAKLDVNGGTDDNTPKVQISGNDAIIRMGTNHVGGPHGLQFDYESTLPATDGMSLYYRTGTEQISFEDSTGVSGNRIMVIGRNGNVGIGTTAPVSNLHIQNSSGANIILNSNTGAVNNGIYMSEGTAATPTQNGAYLYYDSAANAVKLDSGTTALSNRITVLRDNGNVGIGTTSPEAKLEIFGTGNSLRLDSAANQSKTILLRNVGSGTGELKTDGDLRLNAEDAGKTIQFYTVDTERMRITSDGDVSIGTNIGGIRLAVRDTPPANVAVVDFTNKQTTGDVRVIATSLESNGNSSSSFHLRAVTQTVGIWTLAGNGVSSFSSDERLKKNIVTTRDGYLDDIMNLRVVKYHWHTQEDNSPKELGLIAQEVEQVFPNLVMEDNEELNGIKNPKMIKNSVIPYILLKAIQELKAENDSLKARIEALEQA
jgi:hypothetical protein